MSESQVNEVLSSWTISKEEFDSIPVDQRAAVSLVSFARNELDALAKAYICFDHDSTKDPVIDSAIFIQKAAILRNWSATALDFSIFFEENKRNATSDVALANLIKQGRKAFEHLKRDPIFKLVRILRNEVTNHFFLEPAKSNLEFVSADADLSLYHHETGGNGFSTLGSEVMFVARVNKFGVRLQTKEERTKLLSDWMNWNLRAFDWSREVHDIFVREILIKRFPDKILCKKEYKIRPEMAGYYEKVSAPLFLKVQKS